MRLLSGPAGSGKTKGFVFRGSLVQTLAEFVRDYAARTLAVLRFAPRIADYGMADRFDFAVRQQTPNAGLSGLRSLLLGVRRTFPRADLIGEVLVFDLGHNRYRLITTVFFGARELYIKALLTHKEYDREEWKKWC